MKGRKRRGRLKGGIKGKEKRVTSKGIKRKRVCIIIKRDTEIDKQTDGQQKKRSNKTRTNRQANIQT